MPDHPIYVVGDIHGRFDLLVLLVERIIEDQRSHGLVGAKIVFVGDYIDRGDESAKVIEYLRNLKNKLGFPAVFLMGNHEKMMLEFIRSPEDRGARWLRNGGLQTIASYGVGKISEASSAETLKIARNKLKDRLPEGAEKWLRDLPLSYQTGNIYIVHAAADPATDLDNQASNTLLWGHKDFLGRCREDGNWVIHGHTVVEIPTTDLGRIAVDTGAWYTGKLTAAVVTKRSVRFLT